MAILFLLVPTQLMAGGAPRVFLPLKGATAENAEACAKQLTERLKDKVWPHADVPGVQVTQNNQQWFLSFQFNTDVTLSEIDAALKGTKCSVSREALHIFGHVTLEIDPREASQKDLLAGLEALDHVSVQGAKSEKDLLMVTLDMPYPQGQRAHFEPSTASFVTFKRGDFSSDPATLAEPEIAGDKVPGYSAFRDVVARHNASLQDVRWSPNFACRSLGGVAVSKTKEPQSKDTVTSKAGR